MYIDRKAIAAILDTDLANIRSTELDGDIIRVRLWNPRAETDVTIKEYQYFKARSPAKKSVQGGIGAFLMFLGAIVVRIAAGTDTTVSSGFGSVHNIGLVR